MPADAAPAVFQDDVFISYTHVDNQPFGPDALHWVTHLHEQLTNRVQQLFGDRVSVWRDAKLQGNDVFDETLADRLSHVAVLVSVCSPRYLTSEWCQRELDEFLRAAGGDDGVMAGVRSRVFKVLKTPVPMENLPQPLVRVLGYEFYEESPEDSRIREFLLSPDPEERWKFYARVDDLAQDIAAMLAELAADGASQGPSIGTTGQTIYLAETTSDASPHRDRIKRELERRGHRVLPERPLPLTVEGLTSAVEGDLAVSDVSIHLLGARYGARPEGEQRSIPHLQLDIAAQLKDGPAQMIWVPDRLDATEDEQAALIEKLQAAEVGAGTELVRAPLEAFKTHLLASLATPPPTETPPATSGGGKRVYLVCAPEDAAAVTSLKDQIEAQGHVVALPLREGSEAEVREVHEAELVVSDAVLVYYGNVTEHWVRMKLLDLVKAPGWGRRSPFQAKALLLAEPSTPNKATYASTEVLVLNAVGNGALSALGPFLAQLRELAESDK